MKTQLLSIFLVPLLLSACTPEKGLKKGTELTGEPPEKTVQINSSTYWNDTGIYVNTGEEYKFSVRKDALWYDAKESSKAVGYEKIILKPAIPLRRMISAPWFALVCTVDFKDKFRVFDDASCFDNSANKTECQKNIINFKTSGTLYCYANDIPFMYGNNNGILEITIEKLPRAKKKNSVDNLGSTLK